MKHYWSLENISLDNVWLTIGAFDGVHLGHQQIIRPLVSEAHREGNLVVVLTFHPHPVVFLQKYMGAIYLATPQKRAELLGDLGVDIVITQTFDERIANLTARQFIIKLRDHLRFRELWTGYDFAMGRNREADATTLQTLSQEMNFIFRSIQAFKINDHIVSSSLIRSLLMRGEVREAALILGRPYQIDGVVVRGDRRGKTIGFPTANLQTMEQLVLPDNGVYACWISWRGRRYPAAVNIGVRPTFNGRGTVPRVEVHILDFPPGEDLYGQQLSVDFNARLRGERRFINSEALIEQIKIDIIEARQRLMTENESVSQ
jgi:riboflavin kinase/FMN adenylyltransferase